MNDDLQILNYICLLIAAFSGLLACTFLALLAWDMARPMFRRRSMDRRAGE